MKLLSKNLTNLTSLNIKKEINQSDKEGPTKWPLTVLPIVFDFSFVFFLCINADRLIIVLQGTSETFSQEASNIREWEIFRYKVAAQLLMKSIRI